MGTWDTDQHNLLDAALRARVQLLDDQQALFLTWHARGRYSERLSVTEDPFAGWPISQLVVVPTLLGISYLAAVHINSAVQVLAAPDFVDEIYDRAHLDANRSVATARHAMGTNRYRSLHGCLSPGDMGLLHQGRAAGSAVAAGARATAHPRPRDRRGIASPRVGAI
jgi:hypothetical protein